MKTDDAFCATLYVLLLLVIKKRFQNNTLTFLSQPIIALVFLLKAKQQSSTYFVYPLIFIADFMEPALYYNSASVASHTCACSNKLSQLGFLFFLKLLYGVFGVVT